MASSRTLKSVLGNLVMHVFARGALTRNDGVAQNAVSTAESMGIMKVVVAVVDTDGGVGDGAGDV